MQGYEALRTNQAWFLLAGRGRIKVSGDDRARLIHALCTNNIEQLQPGQGAYAFFLNAQGRVLADANIFVLPEFILLDTEPEASQKLLEHIDRHIIADDATLEDVSSQMSTIAVEGPAAAAPGPHLPGAPYGIQEAPAGGYHARVSRTGAGGYWWLVTSEYFGFDGAEQAGAEAVETVRLENARPLYGIDITEANIAHETRQMHALHFAKGCYLGQEIVERVRSRGHVNRMLVSLRIDTDQPPARAAKIQAEGKDIGEITSAAFSPALGKTVALGYIRSEAVNALLTVNGAPASAVPAEPPKPSTES